MISIMQKSKKVREGVAFLLGIALILILIEAGSALKGDRLVFPTAGEISRAFIRLISLESSKTSLV